MTLLQGCRLDVALWEPTGCMFAVSWIRHLAMACGEMFAVHTICLLQLSCPLPRGPQTRRTDLDPHVTLSLSDQLHIYSFFLRFILLSFQQNASSELYFSVCPGSHKQGEFLRFTILIIFACVLIYELIICVDLLCDRQIGSFLFFF